MNPWALLLVLVALLLIVTAARGHQDNLIAAITGRAYGKSTLQ